MGDMKMRYIRIIIATLIFVGFHSTLACEKVNGECEHCGKIIGSSLHGSNGSWLTNDVPHNNWKCTKTEDNYPDTYSCLMCKKEGIRFLHWMKHNNQELPISVDYVCAGMLEGNPEAAKARDEKAQLRSRRRTEWPGLPDWKTSSKEISIKTMVDYDGKDHKVSIRLGGSKLNSQYYVHKIDGKKIYNSLLYRTLEEAKLGAFGRLWPAEIK